MLDYLYIGSTAPYDEKCVLIGQPGFDVRARLEGQLFIDQIHSYYGKAVGSGELLVKPNNHDLGTYYSLEYRYIQGDQKALDYGIMVENDDKRALGRWDALRKPLAKMVCDMKELSDIEDYRRLVLETYRNEINKAINVVNERYEREYGRL
tara:strand:- start:444 stop:896 length:453 start_codon:yes stop_codon:yes gene_type:complete